MSKIEVFELKELNMNKLNQSEMTSIKAGTGGIWGWLAEKAAETVITWVLTSGPTGTPPPPPPPSPAPCDNV